MQMFLQTQTLTSEPRLVLQVSRSGPYSNEPKLQTPSDYFACKYPKLTKEFGPAFLESHSIDLDGRLVVEPVDINLDLFAAILGGSDQRCETVYFTPEQQWYSFNKELEYFAMIDEEALKLRISQELVHCALESSSYRSTVQIERIFKTFRSEKVLKSIVKRAVGILSVDESFFQERTGNRKDPAEFTPEQSARLFAVEALEAKPGEILSIPEAYEWYKAFCLSKGIPVMLLRKEFRSPVVEAVRQTHGMGLSKDLKRNGKWFSGWRNLSAKVVSA